MNDFIDVSQKYQALFHIFLINIDNVAIELGICV